MFEAYLIFTGYGLAALFASAALGFVVHKVVGDD